MLFRLAQKRRDFVKLAKMRRDLIKVCEVEKGLMLEKTARK